MNYIPNFQDPRVLRRIRHAYGFAKAVLSDKPHGWSTRYIDRYFGQQQLPLSKWLRQKLLVVTNHAYNPETGETKQYTINRVGAHEIATVLGRDSTISRTTELDWRPITEPVWDTTVVREFVAREWGQELADRDFQYRDKSNRLWHPLQNVRKQYKTLALADAGLCYSYDIQSAAPSLLFQYAQSLAWQRTAPGATEQGIWLYASAIREYLHDRNRVRNHVAQQVGIDTATAKTTINALFCGARIGAGPDFAISQLLGHDQAAIDRLRNLPYIQELRDDIKTMWRFIAPTMTRKQITDKNGQQRLLAITSREKWALYFRLERQVLDAVRGYLTTNNNRCFLEHDGWTCERPVDLAQLGRHVLDATGFGLSFESKPVFTGHTRRGVMRDLVE
jgi:hypothetical protein